MHVLAICSGAGGLELGVKLANPTAKCVCYVEGEAYVASLLVKHMEEGVIDQAPLWSDIRTFDGLPWRGKVDCLTAGYPCQPFSAIGKRQGSNDPRHLFPHIKRIIEEINPSRLFFENVAGHLSMGFETVANDLQTMGYKVAAGLFTAEEVGTTHKRERLFIMADSQSLFRSTVERNQSNGVDELLPLFPPPPQADAWTQIIKIRPDLEPVVRGMVNGLANRVDRFRGCSNGVVPLVAAYAWRVLEDSLTMERSECQKS